MHLSSDFLIYRIAASCMVQVNPPRSPLRRRALDEVNSTDKLSEFVVTPSYLTTYRGLVEVADFAPPATRSAMNILNTGI